MRYVKRICRAALLTVVVTCCVVGVGAQARGLEAVAKSVGGSDLQIGKQYAVLIAVDRYKEWPSLKAPVQDAQDLKKILQDRYYIDEFVELYDEDASAAGIRQLFGKLIDTVKATDSVLVYYAGHGYTDRFNTGFWIPSDGGRDQQSQERWIPNQQIRNFVSQMKARSVAMIVDACFSGDLLNVSRGSVPTQDQAYYRNALRYSSRQVLTSGASEAVPDESEFSRQLKSFLESNTDPYIDPYTIYDRIRRGVTKTLPLLGTVPGHEQGGSFVLFRKPAADSGANAASVPQSPASFVPAATADLMVSIVGAQEAEILVNGKSVGKAPGLIQKLPAEAPLVVEARSGSYAGKAELTLKAKELREITISMERMKGNLFVEADAKDLSVSLDGVRIGPIGSGLFRDIPAGKHALELRGDGVYYSGDVMVLGNETTKASVRLNRIGALVIDAPKEVTIRITGPGSSIRVFQGGINLDNLAEGNYLVNVWGDDFLTKSTTLTIQRGGTVRWTPYDKGRVNLQILPASASITVGRESVSLPSSGEASIDLAPGKYPVFVRATGYIDKQAEVVIELGKIVRARISLDELPRASLSFPKIPYGATVEVGARLAVLHEWNEELVIKNIPSGIPVSIITSVSVADKLDPAYRRSVVLAPGSTTSVPLPAGRFSVPVLPEGAKLYFLPDGRGLDAALIYEVPFSRRGDRYVSPLLAAGEYTIGMREPYRFSANVSIEDGKEIEPPGYRKTISWAIQEKLKPAQEQLKSKSTISTTSLIVGIGGACLGVASYFLGSQAWKTYQAATTISDALAAKSQALVWATLMPISLTLGGLGLGLSPIISGAAPSQKSLEKSIADMEEALRRHQANAAEALTYSGR